MKVKRFVADDMRNALRLVRDELGPEAVILSNRKVNGQVEILAAEDYDESAISETVDRSTGAGVQNNEPQTQSALDYFESRAAAAPREEPATETYQNVQHQAAGLMGGQQEPDGLGAMRDELKYLRAMIETQATMGEWNRLNNQHPLRISLYRRLSEMGLSEDVCKYLAQGLEDSRDPDQAISAALKQMVHQLPVSNDDILDHGGVCAMVGPTGVGKTTTIAKLAARFAMRHGQRHVALVSTDNYRIGAHEQLQTFGRLLSVPVHTVADGQQLRQVLQRLYDKKLVLIDTAGMSQRDVRLTEQFRDMLQKSSMIRSYLVVPANAQLSTLDEVFTTFRKINPAGCILTKLDEAVTLGSLISALLRHRVPATYVSYGQRVPEDLQPARAADLVKDMLQRARQHKQRISDEFMAVAFNDNVSHANF